MKANPGAAYSKLWVSQFETANQDWRDRLWGYSFYGVLSKPETIEPFLAWAECRLSQLPTETNAVDADTVKAGNYLRDASSNLSNEEATFDRICEALKSSPHLGTAWWLSEPLVYRSGDSGTPDRNRWPPAIKSEITRVAVEALRTDDTHLPLVAQACSILANGAELTPEQRSSVVTSIAHRLTFDSAHLAKLTEIQPITDSFADFTIPKIVRNSSFSSVRLQVAHRRGVAACPVLEMLSLVGKLDEVTSIQPQLDSLMNETQSALELIQAENAKQMELNKGSNGNRGSSGSGFGVELTWPELSSSDIGINRGNIGTIVPGNQPLGTMKLWGTHEPTKQDWLKYLILLHPVMKDKVDAALARLEPATANMPSEDSPSANVTATPKPVQPIYEGKTVTQWLDVIATERSPAKFMEAVKACDTLKDEVSRQKISEGLIQVLPKIDGFARVEVSGRTTLVDDKAFELLSRALAQDQWIPCLASEFQSASPQYRRRLIKQIWRQEFASISDYSPLTQWALDSFSLPADKTSPELATDAAEVLLVLIKKFPEERAFHESSVTALRDCSAMDLTWWLAKPLPPLNDRYKSERVEYWPPALAEVVTMNAIKVLVDQASSSSHVAQAAMILSDAPTLTEEQKTEITNAVNHRLAAAAESAEKIVEVAEIPNAFLLRSVPEFVTDKKVTWIFSSQDQGQAPGKVIVAVELLDLLEKTGTEASRQSGVLALQLDLKDIDTRNMGFGESIDIRWPRFATLEMPIINGGSLAPSDFARFVIAYHPVMKGGKVPEPEIPIP